MNDELSLGQVLDYIDQQYPPQLAEDWDRVGLVLGDRTKSVRKILLAVDPVPAVVDQAVSGGYDLLITHHPLYLRGTSFLSSDDAKGRMVSALIKNNCALFCAHTNADSAPGGVAESLGKLLGISEMNVLVESTREHFGSGRIGTVEAQTFQEFAQFVSRKLPKGPSGILVAGDMDKVIRTVAVSGGAGDSFLEDARRCNADVFVTADLRHHPTWEHIMDGDPALISGSHWATEWPWLPNLGEELSNVFGAQCGNLNDESFIVDVSNIVTEPWVQQLPTEGNLR